MLIDWFTVGAQVLNFVILVWLLKRYLYKPILDAIDARETRIAKELNDADDRKATAQKSSDEFDEKNKQFAKDREALMAKTVLEVKAERDRLLDDARKEASELLVQQRIATRNDATALIDKMMHMAAIEVFDVARRALNDLASAKLEERLGEIFTRRLLEMKPDPKRLLGVALNASNAEVVVRSRFDLAAPEKATIQNALNKTFFADIHIVFETAPESICGIELTVGGQRLSWSIAAYLDVLEEKAQALMHAQINPPSAVAKLNTTATEIPVPLIVAPPAAPAVERLAAEGRALAS